MTGFARAEGSGAGLRWAWEARSVNGRGLDLKLRVPGGWEVIEPQVRARVTARLRRGSVQLTLSAARDESATGADQLDVELLERLLAQGERLAAAGRVTPPRWDGLLRVRGVLRTGGEGSELPSLAQATWQVSALTTLDGVLDALCGARLREGAALALVLIELLRQMEAAAQAARLEARSAAAAQNARLQERLALMQIELDPQRLAQEVALLAAKADVTEELDRLDAHLQEARALLTQGEPIGRRLEFLTQELSREANTLCAKSNSLTLTRLGLDLKTMIDQLREQGANVE